MGKVKKGKKHSHQPKALGKLLLSSDRLQQELEEQQNEEHQRKISEKYNLSELQTNLNSLLSEKRLNACRILSDIYEFNQNAQDTLDVLTNQSILTSLLSRIADTSSLGIQVHASNAIKTLSESKSSTIIEKLISGGIYRTMINLAVSRIDASHFILPSSNTSNSNQSKPTLPREIEFEITFFQNLLYSIANIVARYPIAIQEITTSTSPTNTLEGGVASNSFLTFLFTLLQTPNLHTRVINTVLNVFITFSKVTPKSSSSSSSNTATSPVALIFLQPLVNNNSITGIQLFHQYLTFLIQVGLFHQPAITTPTDDLALIQAFTTSYTIYKEEEYDTLILLLQTIEILLNVLLRCPLNSEGGVIGVSYYIKIAFHLMQLLSHSQDNEYHMTIEEIKKDVEEEEAAKLDYSEVKGIKDTTSQQQTMNVEMNMDETDHSTNPEVNHESTKKENQKNPGKSYLSSIIHHKIDLIEIVSELFVSLIQQVQRQHRGSSLFPSEEEDNDESNDINITPLSSNSSSVALLQCLEECDVFTYLLRHTLPYGKQLFSYCVIPTKSDDNNNQCHIILGEGVRILNVLEKVTIALDLTYSLKSSLFSFVAAEVMMQSVNLAQHFPLYLEHLQFLYECLNRVTATQDATQSVVEVWKAKEEEHLLSLKTVILQQSITFIHILYSFLLYANSSSNPTQQQLAQYFRTNIFRQEGAMKALLTPILFNWMNLPQFELLLSLYHLLFLIINTYTQLLETAPLNAAADSNDFPIPKSIYIFIMNSLMNRVNESACYLYDISKTASSEEEKRKKKNGKKSNKKAGNTSSSKKNSKGGSVKNPSKSVHEMWKDSKQYNLYKSSLLWKDLLVNCLIDLNCSDHKQLHSWYTAYQTNEKLMVVGKKMQEEYEQLVQFHQRNYSFIPLQGENDDEDDVEDEDEETKEEKERILPIAVRLTINDRDKIEETLMNVENFIIYKRSNNF